MAKANLSDLRACRKCAVSQPLTEFHKNARCKAGRLWTCKGCTAEYSRTHQKQNTEKSKRWRERHPGRAAQLVANWRRNNPERARAAQKAQYERAGPERQRAYRRRHPERVKASRKLSRQKHRDKRIAETRAWRERNIDRVKAYQREYDQRDREQRLAKRRARYGADAETHRARVVAWRKAHRDVTKGHKYAYRARNYQAPGTHTVAERMALLKKQRHLCANPHCRVDLRTVVKCLDHIVSLAKGGSNDIKNCQWLCRPCNSRKTTLSQDRWLSREAARPHFIARRTRCNFLLPT